MAFKYKQEKEDEIVIDVEKEGVDGSVTTKTLRFAFSPKKYGILKKMNDVQRLAVSAGKIKSSAKMLEIVEDAKSIFDSFVPGGWDDFLAFLDDDIVAMVSLMSEMVKQMNDNRATKTGAEILPIEPKGEEL